MPDEDLEQEDLEQEVDETEPEDDESEDTEDDEDQQSSQEGGDSEDDESDEPNTEDDDARFERLARERGWQPPKPAEEPKPDESAKPAAESDIPNFMAQAWEEAQAKGLDWEWAQNRAFVMAAQWSQEQASYQSFEAGADNVIKGFENHFIAQGEEPEDASQLAKLYHSRLKELGPDAVRNNEQGKTLQRVALQMAKGDLRDAQVAARRGSAKPPAEEDDEPRSAVGGGTAGRGGRESILQKMDRRDRNFIAEYEQIHNSGKPLTVKQLRELQEEGVI